MKNFKHTEELKELYSEYPFLFSFKVGDTLAGFKMKNIREYNENLSSHLSLLPRFPPSRQLILYILKMLMQANMFIHPPPLFKIRQMPMYYFYNSAPCFFFKKKKIHRGRIIHVLLVLEMVSVET